ncbi:Gfo/Idh/MocA family oxidoreductase [Acetobacteraceae bacterium]|nr:Gfo/Idh/MocA family oxidoreductase [Acetobacteraceae bacterium]
MGSPLRVGIVGAGHFGRFHIQKSLLHPLEMLIGFSEIDKERAFSIAEEFSICFFENLGELLQEVEAVVIATPAITHFKLAKLALESGKHVFLEKPLAVKNEEGLALLRLAEEKKRILKVGHLLTYSLPVQKILEIIPSPSIIEVERCVPYANRGEDVSIAFDLMIHDLELLASLFGEIGVCLEARGRKIKTDLWDEIFSRFFFRSKCQVSLFASRAVEEGKRKISIEDAQFSLEADFVRQELRYFRKRNVGEKIFLHQIEWPKIDLLWQEHDDFTRLCLEGEFYTKGYNAETAFQALCMAERIEEKILDESVKERLIR